MLSTSIPIALTTPPNRDAPFGRGRTPGFAMTGVWTNPRLALVPSAHPLRARTESCIRAVYERVFGARDLVLAPTLIA